VRYVACWLFGLAMIASAVKAATYGVVLGDDRVQEIVRDVTLETLTELGNGNRSVFVTKDFQARVAKIIRTLEAGPSPEQDLRRGYEAFLKGYSLFQEKQTQPELLISGGPSGKVRVRTPGAEITRGAPGELILEGAYAAQPPQEAQRSGKRLVVLQESKLDLYLTQVTCGEVPCQIPPCCNLCARCKGF
jgi:hypothetical protein